jgi:hypothetical protein
MGGEVAATVPASTARRGLPGGRFSTHSAKEATMQTDHRSEPLYRAADLRRIETLAAEQPLMQRAGLAAADLATSLVACRGRRRC